MIAWKHVLRPASISELIMFLEQMKLPVQCQINTCSISGDWSIKIEVGDHELETANQEDFATAECDIIQQWMDYVEIKREGT